MFKKISHVTVLTCFLCNSFLAPQAQAQAQAGVPVLPAVGSMVGLSPAFKPAIIKGLTIDKANPFLFDFIVDTGEDHLAGDALKQESDRMITYFFAALTVPEKDTWVNLSPYEKNRMVPEALGKTAMGRDLLAQDYILKQITASLMYPKNGLGKEFWDKVYAKARDVYGTDVQVPVNTFNKVWIVADKASLYEHQQTAYIVDGHLKVMLEEDYLAWQKTTDHRPKTKDLKRKRQPGDMFPTEQQNVSPSRLPSKGPLNVKATPGDNVVRTPLAQNIIRDLIIPVLEKEVNEGKNFAPLRQIFNSLVLATWFKKNLKQALLVKAYADKNIIQGIERPRLAQGSKMGAKGKADLDPETIYKQYVRSFKKGVFNFIAPEGSSASGGKDVARKYFSGGFSSAMTVTPATPVMLATSFQDIGSRAMTTVKVAAAPDKAMMISEDERLARAINAFSEQFPEETRMSGEYLKSLMERVLAGMFEGREAIIRFNEEEFISVVRTNTNHGRFIFKSNGASLSPSGFMDILIAAYRKERDSTYQVIKDLEQIVFSDAQVLDSVKLLVVGKGSADKIPVLYMDTNMDTNMDTTGGKPRLGVQLVRPDPDYSYYGPFRFKTKRNEYKKIIITDLSLYDPKKGWQRASGFPEMGSATATGNNDLVEFLKTKMREFLPGVGGGDLAMKTVAVTVKEGRNTTNYSVDDGRPGYAPLSVTQTEITNPGDGSKTQEVLLTYGQNSWRIRFEGSETPRHILSFKIFEKYPLIYFSTNGPNYYIAFNSEKDSPYATVQEIHEYNPSGSFFEITGLGILPDHYAVVRTLTGGIKLETIKSKDILRGKVGELKNGAELVGRWVARDRVREASQDIIVFDLHEDGAEVEHKYFGYSLLFASDNLIFIKNESVFILIDVREGEMREYRGFPFSDLSQWLAKNQEPTGNHEALDLEIAIRGVIKEINFTAPQQGQPGELIIIPKKQGSQLKMTIASPAMLKAPSRIENPSPTGGIDLAQIGSGMTIGKDAKGGVVVNVDQALLDRVLKQGIQALHPVIIQMTPLPLAEIRLRLGYQGG